ncbi:FmdE family protein [Desulfonema magnum]|uniref:Molybdenum formylmethanofuran dehydrogenase domain-containing protein n=1 Tax=Desulfonema magnum TaxID=45655 RepID=A0A975BVL2_9BACT|nr:FmdE family protein [Desulfonema magnum]QTA92566.1 Molybdenum formylmethanofuran dehydrogenase domain-containing protein [Desulfonema magnum]
MESMEMEKLKLSPRANFIRAIQENDLSCCLIKTAEIHGHFCPGSALGVMASVYGLRQAGLESLFAEGMENLMAVVEINACFADGIQAVSGCTLGNNSLVYRDLGRHAVTFAIRGEETGVRVRVRPDFRSCIDRAAPEFYPLMEKVIKNRNGSPEEEAAFKEKGREAAFSLIQLPFEDLLMTETAEPDLPAYAPITESVFCSQCGEQVMATKVVSKGEETGLCLMCAGKKYRQVEGQGISEKG